MSVSRLESIRKLLSDEGDDALVLTAGEEIRWASGFTGSSGILVVTPSSAVLFTDGRYAAQAPAEVEGMAVEIVSGDLLTAVGRHSPVSFLSRFVIDSAHVTVAQLACMQNWPGETHVRSHESILAPLVATKDDDEIDRMRRAQAISDLVLEEILSLIRPGISEREIAAEIVYRHMKHGAESMSFDPIVASGPNGALPHARPTERSLSNNELVVLDFGCFVDGYASDMTRMVGIGAPDPDALEAFYVVQEAQRAAQEAVRSNIRACDVDHEARSIIEEAGLGDAFSHSTGHGLGLRIHESPRIATTNEEKLPERAVVTIEPGVYIPGRFGVRIENAVVLHSDGGEALPKSPTDLILL